MSDYPAKQVIVMRKDLNMRKGKMAAQACHASLACYKSADKTHRDFLEWDNGGFAKICVSVDSEDELKAIYVKAREAGLNVQYIVDSGHTEFHMEPTATCLCIGPHYNELIDPITKELKLL